MFNEKQHVKQTIWEYQYQYQIPQYQNHTVRSAFKSRANLSPVLMQVWLRRHAEGEVALGLEINKESTVTDWLTTVLGDTKIHV